MERETATAYLRRPLTGLPEDERLAVETPETVPIARPPGIENLLMWGKVKFPDGKYKGEHFSEVYDQDVSYRKWMLGQKKLTASWALSYQNYIRVRQQEESSSSRTTRGMVSPLAIEKDGLDDGWMPVVDQVEAMEKFKEQREAERAREADGKQRMAEPETRAAVVQEPTPDEIQAMRTQIALLQRELEKYATRSSPSDP